MANNKPKAWTVTVTDNPKFCGKGAGEVHFAEGKAIVRSERLANWFMEHPGYTVKAVEAGEKDS